MLILRDIRRSVAAIVVLTAVLGLGYPALATGFGQLAFPHQANGSLVTRDGAVIGSELAAQAFASPGAFRSRPTATTPPYNAASTTFANLGPTSPALAAAVEQRVAAILALEGPYTPGLAVGDIPVDAVTTSGSGIDPHISPAYAALQAPRVAAVRNLPLDTVRSLIRGATHGRSLGFLGEPGVAVLELNLALDRAAAAR